MTQSSNAKLETDVHEALKQWHQGNSKSNPLASLLVVRRNQHIDDSDRRLSNDVLLNLLNQLEAELRHLGQVLRLRFLDQLTVVAVANRLNIAEGTVFKYQKQAIGALASMLDQLEQQARIEAFVDLEVRLSLPPEVELFGIEPVLGPLQALMTASSSPWFISLEGLGGIGKTALANAIIREVALSDQFEAVGWVSAKQEFFNPAVGIESSKESALTTDNLVDQLLEQLHPEPPPTTNTDEKLVALKTLLRRAPHFIVIDNLETVADYQSLLPVLRELVNPSRLLLTSRVSLHDQADVHCVTLKPLSRADTLNLLRHEAEVRHIPKLAQATTAQLERIYAVVGGNPLALKLVVGQLRSFPLAQVIENLQQAQGKTIDALYTYIYWQIWHTLEQDSQQVLLMMPLAQDGDLKHIAAVTKFEIEPLNDVLQQLINFNLVNVGGGLEETVYRIHRLTETFLLNEVAKW